MFNMFNMCTDNLNTGYLNFSYEDTIKINLNCIEMNIDKVNVTSLNLKYPSTLIKFDLSNNHISYLPNSFLSAYHELVEFGIKKNKLIIINEQHFKYNTKLKVINLKSNDIAYIHKYAFRYNIHLKFLSIEGNKLNKLDECLFKFNINVKRIVLNNNHIRKIQNNLFINNINLENIYLTQNKIEIIEEGTFSKNLLLEKIFLGNNSISEIRGSWQHLKLLKLINLESNRLKTFNEDIFNVKIFYFLKIVNNNFECACDMIWTKDYKYKRYVKADSIKTCNRSDRGKIFSMRDFFFPKLSNYEEAHIFINNLKCTKGY